MTVVVFFIAPDLETTPTSESLTIGDLFYIESAYPGRCEELIHHVVTFRGNRVLFVVCLNF